MISVRFVLNKMDMQGQGLLVDHLARGLEIQVEKNVESEQERTVCPKLENKDFKSCMGLWLVD